MLIENLGQIVNHDLQPVTIKAPSGQVTWRQILGYWSFDLQGQLHLGANATVEESDHDALTLQPGGFARMIRDEGKFVVFGTGLSASPPLPSG